jgi:uncharacterized membrane protein (DUF2068 family)
VEREPDAGPLAGRDGGAGTAGAHTLTAAEAGPPTGAAGNRPDRLLRLIACFKFGKAALATMVGLGALRLLQPGPAAWADRWLSTVAVRHDRRVLQQLLALVIGLRPRALVTLAVGAFVLTGLFTIEGVGLWLGKRWGQYLTVIATMVFVPVEVVQVVRVLSATRMAALLLNLAVVALLVNHLVRRRGSQNPAGHIARREEP